LPKTGFLTHNFSYRYASRSIKGSIDVDFGLVFKKKNVFFISTRRLAECVECLNSSLALAAGNFWPKKGQSIEAVNGLKAERNRINTPACLQCYTWIMQDEQGKSGTNHGMPST